MGISITNKDFLKAVFNSPTNDLSCWVTAFKVKPSEATYHWAGESLAIEECLDFKDSNAYFSTALFPSNIAKPARQIKNAQGMYVVVLDDSEGISLPPSWKLETSPGNHQIGYILSEPITDMGLARRLLISIGQMGGINNNDPNGNNPVRYVRLPVGSNNKRGMFKHNLVELEPTKRYSLEAIIEAMSLDAEFIINGTPKGVSPLSRDFESLGDGIDVSQLEEIILSSEHFHDQMRDLIAHKIAKGTSPREVQLYAQNLLYSIPEGSRRVNWQNDFNDIPHMIEGAVHKFTPKPLGLTVDMNTGEVIGPVQDQKYGDIYNGRVFADMYRGKMLFCHSNNTWLRWDGNIWEWCTAKEEDIAAKKTVREIAKLAGEEFVKDPGNQAIKRVLANAMQMLNNQKRVEMLKAASTEPGMYITSMGELDGNIMLLGCENGTINLKTGTLLQSDPSMLISKKVSAIYEPQATAPQWMKFISECFLGNEEDIRYMQKVLGYSLTGDVSEELIHFIYGVGCNGKTLLTNVIYTIMGDYAAIADTEMLMRKDKHDDNSPSPDIARLQGKRFVVANEVEEGRRLNDKNLKVLGSKQTIKARELYGKSFEFMPTHKIFCTTNHKPYVSDTSEGAWRRIRLIPFLNRISVGQIDFELEDKLLTERSGILNWLIEGCLLWQREHLKPTLTIQTHSQAYREESDTVGLFITECCITGPNEQYEEKMLYSAWRNWCHENGHKTTAKGTLTTRLDLKGITQGWQGKTRVYRGLKLIHGFGLDTPPQVPQV